MCVAGFARCAGKRVARKRCNARSRSKKEHRVMPDQTNSSKAKRDLLEKYLRGEIPSSLESRNRIAPRGTGNVVPLSLKRQQVWLHHHIVPDAIPVEFEALTFQRTGPMDPAVLERCLREI